MGILPFGLPTRTIFDLRRNRNSVRFTPETKPDTEGRHGEFSFAASASWPGSP